MKRSRFKSILIVLMTGTLISCGGGGGGTSAGIGGTGITSSGTITAVGSIYVNGVRYNVDNATISVNDNDATPAELKIGMVVTVTGNLDSNGSTTGTADAVVYDNEIQGPVAGLNDPTGDGLVKQFTVMGQMVEISNAGTVFEDEAGGNNFNFTTIKNGDNVEVSGFVDQNGILQATRLEKKSGSEVELKGTVASYDPNAGAASMGSFTLGAITVEIDGNTDTSNVPGGIANGLSVEVKGSLAGTILTAREIELNDDGLGDDVSSVSLEGIVTNFATVTNFMVAGQQVNANGASFEPSSLRQTLADGIKIEVEGDIVNGILIADEVESRSGQIKLQATVSSVVGSVITMGYFPGTVAVLVDNKTSFKDGLTLATIVAGTDFLEIEGYQDSAGNVIASQVKRNSIDKDLLQGPVDGPINSGGSGTISVLGVIYTLNLGASYADENEVSLTNAEFFAQLNAGDTVKIVDKLEPTTDGNADEIEME